MALLALSGFKSKYILGKSISRSMTVSSECHSGVSVEGEKETHAPSAWEIIENEAAAASNVVKTQYSLKMCIETADSESSDSPVDFSLFVGKVRRPMSRKKGGA